MDSSISWLNSWRMVTSSSMAGIRSTGTRPAAAPHSVRRESFTSAPACLVVKKVLVTAPPLCPAVTLKRGRPLNPFSRFFIFFAYIIFYEEMCDLSFGKRENFHRFPETSLNVVGFKHASKS